MVRAVSAMLLVAALLFPAVGGASVAPTVYPVITLSGELNYETSTLVPHYELEGYILLHPDSAELDALVGQRVIVVGRETDKPSIYMRRTMEVQAIRSARSDANQPGEGDPVIMPVWPGPVAALPPAQPGLVSFQPVPFFGTAMVVLFGQIQFDGQTYFIVSEQDEGPIYTPVLSNQIDLPGLLGEQVAVVAAPQVSSSEGPIYRVESAVVVTDDLGGQIALGEGVIYQMPHQEITLRIDGQVIETDQAPVLGNSRTLVGLRAVAESLGATVRWDEATRTAFVSLDGSEVSVQSGSNRLTVWEHGRPARTLQSDISAIIVNGRLMVPLRLIAETLGLDVQWDSASWTVDLSNI